MFGSSRKYFFKDTSAPTPSNKDLPSASNATHNYTLDLITCGYHEIPRTFKISTNNMTYSFNADILKDLSPTIKEKLQSDPNLAEFRIWVSDSANVMQKFEDLLRFSAVEISQTELPILRQIFGSLQIDFNLFDSSKSSTYRLDFRDNVSSQKHIHFGGKSLKIISNGKIYECSLNGACSSNIIKEIIESNPTCDTFQYNLNEDEDFSLIQRFFNFESISINTHNMDFLEKVCKELQIDCLIEKVEQFIQSFSNQLLLAESNDHLVEPISDLFESLYSIDTEGSEQVCHHILETEWIQDESNIPEMISCILQVIRTNLRLHPYILELIVLLNKELNNSNESNQFLPIFRKRLLSESNKSLLSCAFLYKLQERQIITFKEISEFFQNPLLQNSYPETIQLIFQPELKEHGIDSKENSKQNNSNKNTTFILGREKNSNNKKNSRLSIDSSQYPEMRKSFEPLNEILRLIIQDDYEKLQIKISQENIDINQSVQVISLIDSTDEHSYVSLINYAAEYGSTNCFKYLFVNHAEQSSNLLIHAVKGGNPEIIQISHSAMKKLIPDLTPEPSNTSFSFNSQKKCMSQFDVYLDCLIVSIRMHRYSIIDWILTQIRDINAIKDLHSHLDKLYDACKLNGNVQALITFMNYGINIPEFLNNIKNSKARYQLIEKTNYYFSSLIQQGFYHFIQFLFQMTNQKQIDYLCFNNPSLVVRSQNIKILHLFTNLPVDQLLYLSIKSNYFSLVDNIMKDFHYCCESTDYYNIYLSSVTNKSVPMFKLITSKYPLEQSKQYIESSQYLGILCKACESCNYEAVLAFTDVLLSIDKDTYFTSPFHKALSAFSSPICEFFIEKNVNLDLIDISKNTKIIQLDNGKFAPLLFEKADKSIQLQLFYFLLYQFITSSLNEHHKEYIAKLLALNKSDQINSMLNEISPNSPFVFSIIQGNFYVFDAFLDYFGDQLSDHIDQINFALKYLSETSFIDGSFNSIYRKLTELVNEGMNISYQNDTFLTMAVKQSNIELLQLCLQNMKDQQIFDEVSIKNPFVYAIKTHNLGIFNAFLDYFGDNITKQTSQINYGLSLLLEDYYYDANDRNNRPNDSSRKSFYQSDDFINFMKRLFEVNNLDLNISYRNDTFLSLAVKQSNLELLQLCLENIKDQQIFDEVSINNPFIYGIKTRNINIFNAFIDYFGDNISNQISQINYALTLLLEECNNSNYSGLGNFNPMSNPFSALFIIIKRLLEATNFELAINYYKCLKVAVKQRNIELLQLCLTNMKDQQIFDEISLKNPFIYAIKTHNFDIFNAFVDYFGDNISKQTSQINYGLTLLLEDYYDYSNDKNNRPNEIRPKPFNQSKDFINFMKRLFEVNNFDLNITYRNDTFLTLAIKQSNLELLQLCLENIKDQQIFDEISNKNPFIYAIQTHNFDIFNAFIDYFGDNISKQTSQLNYGSTLLLKDYYADSNDKNKQPNDFSHKPFYQSKDFINFMKRLFEVNNFDLNITYRNDTFLTLAIKQSNLELLQLCLENIKDQQIFDEISNKNPFIYAIQTHNLKVIKIFIDYFGDNISKQTSQINYGLTLLLEDYYNSNNSGSGISQLNSNSVSDLSIIIKQLCEVTNFQLDINYEKFVTMAIKRCNIELLQLCLANMKNQQIFDEVSIKNPFIYAIKKHNLDVVNIFLDFFGDNISKQTSQLNYGLTLLLEDYYNKSNFASMHSNRTPSSQSDHFTHKGFYKSDGFRILSDSSRKSFYQSDAFIIFMKRLFEANNFDLNISYRNDTFLTMAVKQSNIELLQLCLVNLKDQQIFDEVSVKNPFVYAIKTHNLNIFNIFLDFFGDNISKQTSQINYGLTLLLEDYYNSNNSGSGISQLNSNSVSDLSIIIKQLCEVTNFQLDINYEKFVTMAIKRCNIELLQLCLANMKNQQIFDEVSNKNPFIYAIKKHNLDVVNIFLDFFGDNISKQTSQINYGLSLLLEDYYDYNDKNNRSNDSSRKSFYQSDDFINFMKRLFEVNNFDLNIRHQNDTFLSLAVKQSNLELLQFCLANLKDQHIFDEVSIENPFVYAIITHHLDSCNAFLNYFGDNISKQTSQINYALTLLLEDCPLKTHLNTSFTNRRGILDFFGQIIVKVPDFDHDILFKLYNLGEDPTSFLFLQKYMDCHETKTGNTLLMAAILSNKPEIAILLAQCEGVDYKTRNYNNQTALTLALDQMEKENHKNQFSLSSNQQDIPIEEKYSQLIRLLIKTIDRDEIDRVFYFCNDVVAQELILNKDLNINYIHITPHNTNSKTNTNITINFIDRSHSSISPLHYSTSLLHSIEKNYHIKSELIINHPHFNPQLSNANEAVFSIIKNKNFQIFNRLLDFVDINILNSKGESLLLHCCMNNFKEGVHRILNDSKFDPVKVHFDTILLTVLQCYTNSYIQFDIMNLLVDYDSKHSQILHFDQLLPNGKSFFTQIKIPQDNHYQNRSNTPFGFHKQSQPKDENIKQYINFFLNKGVDPNKPDRFGVYPLQHSIQIKSLPFVQVLLNSGKIDYSIKINTNSIKNGTYLHLAAFSSGEITQQLIASKAFDLEFKDDLGQTPYMIAQNEINKKESEKETLSANISTTLSFVNKEQLSHISSLLTNDLQKKSFRSAPNCLGLSTSPRLFK